MVLTLQRRHDVLVAIEGQTSNDRKANIGVHGVDEVPVRVGVDVVHDDQICGRSRCERADLVLPVGGLSCSRCDHFDQFVIGEDVAQHLVVPQVGDLQFVERRLGAGRGPVRCKCEVDTGRFGRSDVGGLPV